MCAESSINTKRGKKEENKYINKKCYVSPVTNPTATATDPPLLVPPLCTEGWFPKTQKDKKYVYRYANITPFDKKSPSHRDAGFPDLERLKTHIAIYQLNRPVDRLCENKVDFTFIFKHTCFATLQKMPLV